MTLAVKKTWIGSTDSFSEDGQATFCIHCFAAKATQLPDITCNRSQSENGRMPMGEPADFKQSWQSTIGRSGWLHGKVAMQCL